jgi:hypothetical protein
MESHCGDVIFYFMLWGPGLQPQEEEREEEWKESDYILLTRQLALCKLQFKLDQSSRAELRLVGSERERLAKSTAPRGRAAQCLCAVSSDRHG